MGVPAYNLVIVKGEKEELNKFQKLAYQSDSNAFRIEQLLPPPSYIAKSNPESDEQRAYRTIIYGSNWVAAFGVLVEKSDQFLKYFFNSKWTKAELDFVAIKFDKLKFTHVFREIADDTRFGVIEYECGEKVSQIVINVENINWGLVCEIHTYLYIEELWLKFRLLYQEFPQIIEEVTWPEDRLDDPKDTILYNFYDLFPEIDFLRVHESLYDSIYALERALETQDIDDAINQTGYPLILTPPDEQLKFINKIFLSPEKRSQMSEDVIHRLNSIKWGTDLQKLRAFIIVHQYMNMPDWLYWAVKRFLTRIIKKMKLYLIEVSGADPKAETNRKWYSILGDRHFDFIKKADFQDWIGLENEQASFWNLWERIDSILRNPGVPSLLDEDLDLPF